MAVHRNGRVIECGEGCEVCGDRYSIGDAPLDVGDGACRVDEREAPSLGSNAIALGALGRVGQRFEIDTAG